MTDTLALTDLEQAVTSDMHNGYGYAAAKRAYPFLYALDAAVLDAANRLGWDFADLFLWADSKPARWLGDQELTAANVGEVVPRFLNDKELGDLWRESWAGVLEGIE